jgi:methylenetetrahydrofolate dehydrogenase (NADP+)/methenyltetrahydrofolate cyclohydrolase
MTARILDGKALAARIRQNLQAEIEKTGLKPMLAVLLIGHDPASELYVAHKQKAAAQIGIETKLYRFNDDVSENVLLDLIHTLNRDPTVNGIMIQLPLPTSVSTKNILHAVSPLKDVDGFHPYNVGLLQNNDSDAVIAATPKGILRLLQEEKIEIRGSSALVIGRSQIVGKPMAMLLLNQDATVTVAHSLTKDLPALTAQADIVVAACGVANLIKGTWLKKGAVVIDVGINHVDGHLCGDVEFESAKQTASAITPVPGGVGPLTIAMLLENTFEAAKKQVLPL